MTHRLHNMVYATIDTIDAAEKVTKTALASLSRDMLVYVTESHDIDYVNKLLSVLTPMNEKAAIIYFGNFLPFTKEKDTDGNFLRFGKMLKGDKKVAKKVDAIRAWLEEEENTIWTWVKDNVTLEQRDLHKPIVSAITKALKGDEKTGTPPLTVEEILRDVFSTDISVDDVLNMASTVEVPEGDGEDFPAIFEDYKVEEVAA